MTVPDPIDIHVGSRLKRRRLWIGMSQIELGKRVGLTHQQIQKYEKAQNQTCASRLFHLAQALDVPVDYFFEDMSSLDTPPNSGMAELESSGYLHEILSRRDTLHLNRAFIEIEDTNVRRSVIDLIRSLAD